MGMGVPIRGDPVGGPAGVPDAEVSGKGGRIDDSFESGELAFRLGDRDRSRTGHGQAGGVVASILQPG